MLQRLIEGPVEAQFHGGPRTEGLRTNCFLKISELPKQDLCVRIRWKIFALSLGLRGAADQGQTAKEMAAVAAAECEEGEDKQDYLKIVFSLEDPLESTWSAVRGRGPSNRPVAT